MNPILEKVLRLLTMIYALISNAFSKAREEARTHVYSWRIFSNTKAEGMGAGVVGTLIGIMVSLLIAIIIVNNLINSQTPDANWSTDANSTWTTLQTNIWVAITLLVIIPIIVGAVIILSYVRRGM